MKIEEIEDNDIVPEKLPEAPGKDDITTDVIGDAHFKADGTLQLRKKTISNLPLPANPQQLRTRIRMMGRCWNFAKLEVPKCGYPQGPHAANLG